MFLVHCCHHLSGQINSISWLERKEQDFLWWSERNFTDCVFFPWGIRDLTEFLANRLEIESVARKYFTVSIERCISRSRRKHVVLFVSCHKRREQNWQTGHHRMKSERTVKERLNSAIAIWDSEIERNGLPTVFPNIFSDAKVRIIGHPDSNGGALIIERSLHYVTR